jgi:periplasmic divalent cation tolerance protein
MMLALVNCASRDEARKIGRHLLEKRLAACVNVLPVESSYWWKGKIENAKEWMLVAKSVRKNFGRIKAEVKKMHSYDVPEVAMVDARADKDYLRWLESIVG